MRAQSCISCNQSEQSRSLLHFLHPHPCSVLQHSSGLHFLRGILAVQFNKGSWLHFLLCIRAVQFGEGSRLHFLHPIRAEQIAVAFPAPNPCRAARGCIFCTASLQCNSVRAQSCISCTQSLQGSLELHFRRCIFAVQFGEGSELHFLHPIRAEHLGIAFPALHQCSAIQ